MTPFGSTRLPISWTPTRNVFHERRNWRMCRCGPWWRSPRSLRSWSAGASPTSARRSGRSFYVTGLDLPVAMVQDPSRPLVQYVVEKTGQVRVISGGVLLAQSFLDVSTAITMGGEQGLLGLAISRSRIVFSSITPTLRETRSSHDSVGRPATRFAPTRHRSSTFDGRVSPAWRTFLSRSPITTVAI